MKEILQMMVADGIVQSDKIGISNCTDLLWVSSGLFTDLNSLLELSFCSRGYGMTTLSLSNSVVDIHTFSYVINSR